MPSHRPPWSIEDNGACFIVNDSAGQKLAYVYFEDERWRRSAAKLLLRDIRRDPSRLTNQHDLDQRPGVDHGREFGVFKHRERHALLDCYGAFCGYFAVRQL
jgi:hypothetical protein